MDRGQKANHENTTTCHDADADDAEASDVDEGDTGAAETQSATVKLFIERQWEAIESR